MSANRTIGSCSICGGAVVVPTIWHGVNSPVPSCSSCGATPQQPHGPVIEMEPAATPANLAERLKRASANGRSGGAP